MAAEILTLLATANIVLALAIALVLAARPALRRLAGAQAAYRLWAIPALALAATLLPPRPAETGSPLIAEAAAAAHILFEAGPAEPQQAARAASAAPPDAPQQNGQTGRWLALAFSVWLGGALVCAGTGAMRSRRALKGFRPLTRQGAVLRAHGREAGPAVLGAARPRIVLPADFETRYSPAEQELILAHEAAHLRGGHTRANAAAAAICALCWFNPLVHLAAALMRTDQELACDAAVGDRWPQARRAYGAAVLKALSPARPAANLCVAHSASFRQTKERLTMLSRPIPGGARRRLGAALGVALGAGAAYSAWAAAPASRPIGQLPELVCDAWSGKYTSDPIVDWSAFPEDGSLAVRLHHSDRGAGPVTLPGNDAVFPAEAFPALQGNAGVRITMGGETISYRVISDTLVDTLVFYDLDEETPGLKWQRLRLAEGGPYESFLNAMCRPADEG